MSLILILKTTTKTNTTRKTTTKTKTTTKRKRWTKTQRTQHLTKIVLWNRTETKQRLKQRQTQLTRINYNKGA